MISQHCLTFSATTLQPHWFPFRTLNKPIPPPSQGFLTAWISLHIVPSDVWQLSWISFQKSIPKFLKVLPSRFQTLGRLKTPTVEIFTPWKLGCVMAGFFPRVHHFPSDLRPNISSPENPSWQLHLKYGCFCCSVAKSCPTLCNSMDCSTPVSIMSSIISWSLLIFMSIESTMLSNYLIHCYPLPFAFSFSQHQGLFQWVVPPHQVKSK